MPKTIILNGDVGMRDEGETKVLTITVAEGETYEIPFAREAAKVVAKHLDPAAAILKAVPGISQLVPMKV